MKYTFPTFKGDAFNCPFCEAYSHMRWRILSNGLSQVPYYEAACSNCKKATLWRVTDYHHDADNRRVDANGQLTYPDHRISAPPDKDMPEDVKGDFEEAASIFSRSPRGAAALLRLGLQKLCKHLGEDGENIDKDIRNLASKNVLPPLVVKVADTVRITGNNAVHPGEMSDEDLDHVASKMFDLINFIVKKGISEPKELQALYELTPEGPRKAAEKKDDSALRKKQKEE